MFSRTIISSGTLIFTLLSSTIFANSSPQLFQFVGLQKATLVTSTVVACPPSIDTQNDQYATVPASINALFKTAEGGGLTAGHHELTKVSVYVATKPGYVGLIACQYGHISDNRNYVFYQNAHNTVQYYPASGSWQKTVDQIGYNETCTSDSNHCTFQLQQ